MLRLQRDGMELKLLGRGAVLLGFLSGVPLGLSGAGHKEGGAAFLPWEGLSQGGLMAATRGTQSVGTVWKGLVPPHPGSTVAQF